TANFAATTLLGQIAQLMENGENAKTCEGPACDIVTHGAGERGVLAARVSAWEPARSCPRGSLAGPPRRAVQAREDDRARRLGRTHRVGAIARYCRSFYDASSALAGGRRPERGLPF